MGILEVLTVVFVVLKLMSIIDWSWWLVLSPILFAFAIYLLMFNLIFLGMFKFGKKRR